MLSTLKSALLLTVGPVLLMGDFCFAGEILPCGVGKICRPQKELPSSINSPKYPKLLVFVSFAMPMESLKTLAGHVNTLGGAIVFRGLVEGSFKKTALKLKELACEAMIDPTLFEAYEVKAVPTYILRGSETHDAEEKVLFDRISGNVSLHYVLEEFAQKGEIQEEARALLQKLKRAS